MKRFFSHVVILLLVIGLTAACGGNGETGADGAAKKDAAKAGGEAFENAFFKATITDGWTVFDDSKVKMMRIYPKNDTSMYAPTIHLKFEGNGNWPGTPEGAITDFAKNYKGSAAQKEVINGLEYYKTTYEYGGHKQTMMVAKKDGSKITISLVGADYDTNPAIPQILKTIVIK